MIDLDPEQLPPPDRYGLMISAISPRPIAWVSTIGEGGALNLAPFSFFTGICAIPMTLCFAPVRDRHGNKKDTLVNIEAVKQFVVNVVTEETAAAMNQTSANYPYGVSEFEKAGLTPIPSVKVRPPAVKESPIHLECELFQIVTISEGPIGGSLVIGKVVHIRVEDRLWRDGKIRHEDLRPIGRMEGAWYAKTADAFELPRPRI